MLPTESAPLLYRELARISARNTPDEQVAALAALMERIFLEATRKEQIAFSTLFARISYAGQLYHIQPDVLRRVHRFRLATKWIRSGQPANTQTVRLGLRAVSELVLVLTGAAIPLEVMEYWSGPEMVAESDEHAGTLTFAAAIRVVATEDLPNENTLLALDDENPGQPVRVRYGLSDRNENFMPTIRVIRQVFGFPVALNLLDVDIANNGEYRPRIIVVEPDYLVDVSAIAECFKDTGPEPYAYLVKKFLPYDTTDAILLGNIANYFLDRLLNEPDAEWSTVFRETFRLYPLIYASMTDAQVKTVSGKAQKHFLNLKNMTAGALARQGIEPENSFLEPTFFSERYGIQGRLDLFYRTEGKSAIVELKSGTPFKPNSYGIQRSHFTQTLLYDLLVRSVYGAHTDPAKYILYSGIDIDHLRFAPTVAPEQWEALQLRNQLVAIERLLTGIRPGDVDIPLFSRLRAAKGTGFMQRDFGRFEAAYGALSETEKKYFNAFTGFIAREHWLAKNGEEGAENTRSHAALWRSSFSEKQQAFGILSHLKLAENRADQPEPGIVFKKTTGTNPLANFRPGDIAVLYPALEPSDNVLQHQVIKCTITELGPEHVTVQLRYRQHNLKPFSTDGYWCLEADFMDMGFTGMYRSLLEWAEAGREKRGLLLGGNPTPDPSPEGRGDTLPLGMRNTSPVEKRDEPPLGGEDTLTEAVYASGVGLPPPKTGSFGEPEETAPLDRWQYLKNFARIHREYPTDAEKIMWEALRGKRLHGIKFRRQHAIDEYIVDFVCLEYRLAIEVDGDIHALQSEYDEQRTEYLGWFGFAVIRFTNDEVMNDLDTVLGTLEERISVRKMELEQEEKVKGDSQRNPSPEGRGDTLPLRSGNTLPEAVRSTAPLPSGEGSGVGLLARITQSRDYFLLWGPPGTGKTSIMLRDLAAWVLNETSDNLLLLAYTNKAVDEICEALDHIGGDIREQYLRIGGRHAAAARFHDQLLGSKIATANTRAELRTVLDRRRIFVSTVASFGQNESLLKLKTFQRLIVDEASQILEPQLIGLLTRFRHFILIGDHRQLPAVTTQRPETTVVADTDLNGIGLHDLRESYFERLYRRCQEQGWHWAYGRLGQQGRMHADIMDFPNRYFYDGLLQTLNAAPDSPQHRPLDYTLPGLDPTLEHIFAQKRVVFLPVEQAESLSSQKTSLAEAAMTVRIITAFKAIWAANDRVWHPEKTLGVITPWRAQIAQIRECLTVAGLDPDTITIDTVERYQGGARDIILISTCTHSAFQLESLVNLNKEGVDRKLNVALTRAREHLIMLGNAHVLGSDERYKAFIGQYHTAL
jgi:very-short-patch-repair endonuclease